MSAQPEALRLADAFIEDAADHLDVSHAWDMRPEATINHRHYMNAIQAVVELRRLHAESQASTDALFQAQEAAKSLLAQRDALLEAVRVFVSCALPVSTEIDERGHRWTEAYLDQALPIARAAIAKAEGNT